MAKECVQASVLNQCDVKYSKEEQYVTINIVLDMIAYWKWEGYTHIHFGAVRIILSYQGRKCLPITARLALLDSRYLKYSQAMLGTCLTTLNAGSAVLTIYPNYTVSLNDPNLPSLL
jgi:hypothetical protein